MKNINIINCLRFIIAMLALVISGALTAQGWQPERHVELIVPSSAGGSLDNVGRTFQRLWTELKLVPVSSAVVNRAGGGHAIAYNFLNQQAGDAHFMSITSSTLHTSNINGRVKLSHRDFTSLVVMMAEYISIAVRPDSPLKTGKDLSKIAHSDQFKTLAQKNQWEINYKNAAETLKFLEGEYTELKEVMDFLGLSK